MRAVVVALVQWVRVVKPAWLAPVLVGLRTTATWARPSGRAEARAGMRLLLGDLPHPALDALARRHVRFSCLRSEARFDHLAHGRQRIVGGEHLASAVARGRGVILGFVHHGHYEGAFPSVAAAGFPLTVVAAAATVAAREGDPQAEPWRTHHARTMTSHPDCRLVTVGIGFHGMLGLLAEGRTIALACDFPGGRERVPFLGRAWFGLTSVAGLAVRSGAPVVPMVLRPVGRDRSYVELGAPLLPEEFRDATELTAAVLGSFEAGVLAWPEAYDVPTQMWVPFPD